MHRRSLILSATAACLATPVRAAAPAVVLELFTSEGCSSCPPADALLGELARRPGVIALAWHVDYWDGLGWRDPFASRRATERQHAYATHLQDEVYTPALVVNGAAMVVGSDRAAVAGALGRGGGGTVPVTLRREGGALTAEIGDAPGPVTALLVGYDPMRVTPVAGGENGGRRLTEYNIVREATVVGASRRLILPPVAAGRGAVLLVQDEAMRMVGAAKLDPAANMPA